MPLSTKLAIDVPGLEDSSQFGYSHAIRWGSTVYLAGQCGLNTDHEIVSTDFEEQARAALDRVALALRAAGGNLDDVVSMTVFITDTRLGRVFTSLRREYFNEPYPASALIGVSQLMPLGAMVEVQAIAVIG